VSGGHAEQHYLTPEGKPTSQLAEYRQTLRVVRDLYGLTAATAFGPRALKAVREKMVSEGLARSEVNRRVALADESSNGGRERTDPHRRLPSSESSRRLAEGQD